MTEKEFIEAATAQIFLAAYNKLRGASYAVQEVRDAPDVRCVDGAGHVLNIEVVLTQDRDADVAALLGRHDSRSIESLRAHLQRVSEGKEELRFAGLDESVSEALFRRIQRKMQHDYGPNCALVIRDVSGVHWDWDLVMDGFRARLSTQRNPFARGIWLLRPDGRVFGVVNPHSESRA